jgi:hypothetical protein
LISEDPGRAELLRGALPELRQALLSSGIRSAHLEIVSSVSVPDGGELAVAGFDGAAGDDPGARGDQRDDRDNSSIALQEDVPDADEASDAVRSMPKDARAAHHWNGHLNKMI